MTRTAPPSLLLALGSLFGALGIIGLLSGQPSAAFFGIGTGLVMWGTVAWDRRNAPRLAESNRKWREGLIRDPSLWTDDELDIIRHSGSVDHMYHTATRAMQRRTAEAERWFVSHFFEHGPEWMLTVDGADPVPVTIQRYGDLIARLPPTSDLLVYEHTLLAEVWAATRKGRRRPLEATWEFRPAHCRCVMPSWRTDPTAPPD